ncbi:MAG: DUF3800 domain-containing protein [Candidatus Paceibacterota bacterium]
MIYSIFLDESGIESYNDPQQYYVVAGSIFDREYVRSTVMPQINNLKRTYFGNENTVFHFTEMKGKRNNFGCLNNQTIRSNFWNDYFSYWKALISKLLAR